MNKLIELYLKAIHSHSTSSVDNISSFLFRDLYYIWSFWIKIFWITKFWYSYCTFTPIRISTLNLNFGRYSCFCNCHFWTVSLPCSYSDLLLSIYYYHIWRCWSWDRSSIAWSIITFVKLHTCDYSSYYKNSNDSYNSVCFRHWKEIRG